MGETELSLEPLFLYLIHIFCVCQPYFLFKSGILPSEIKWGDRQGVSLDSASRWVRWAFSEAALRAASENNCGLCN